MRKKWSRKALAASWVLLLAISIYYLTLGASHSHIARAASGKPTTTSVTQLSRVTCPPPAGEGFMGVCQPKPMQVYPGGLTAPLLSVVSGGRFPDVSSWQGTVNWSTIINWQRSHGWRLGGVFKMGEYGVDPYAFRNNAALTALHAFRAGYWFVRATGCASEANQIISEARLLHLTVVIEDDEVPEAAGYSTCLTPRLRAAGFVVVIYTSPGSFPGGAGENAYAWMAAFGPALPSAPFATAGIKAWQCSDGVAGCITDIPGLGRTDVSVDYGMLGLAATDPYAIFPKARFTLAHGIKASEYNTYRTWVTNHCTNPTRRAVCTSSHYHASLLRDREYFVATHKLVHGRWVAAHPARWSFPNSQQPLGSRFQRFSHIL